MDITSINQSNYECFSEFTGSIKQDQGALGLIIDDYAVGAAVFTLDGDACLLDHIYIDSGYRRMGGGTFLINCAMEAMQDAGVDTFIAYYTKNEEVTALLENVGFVCTPDSTIHTVDVEDVYKARNVLKIVSKKIPREIMSLNSIDDEGLRFIASMLQKNGYSDELIKASNLEKGLSFVEKKNGDYSGVLLAKVSEEQVYVTMLLSFGVSNHVAMSLLAAFLQKVMYYPKKIRKICFLERMEKVLSVVSTLMGREDKIEHLQMWSAIKFII